VRLGEDGARMTDVVEIRPGRLEIPSLRRFGATLHEHRYLLWQLSVREFPENGA